MNFRAQKALLVIALCAATACAQAQKIYRCGSHYSQTPCEGAVEVNADDARSAAQKTDSQKAIARDGRTASAMEKARLQEEEKRNAQDALLHKAEVKANKEALASNKKTSAHTGTPDKKKASKSTDEIKGTEPFVAKKTATGAQ